MHYVVFVSHASVDTWVASRIAERIRAAGAETFVDAADIRKGDDYDDVIRDALQRCDELVVLMTPAARDSRNVWMEIGALWARRGRVVGILYGIAVRDVQTDSRMPQGFRRIHLLDIDRVDDYVVELGERLAREQRDG